MMSIPSVQETFNGENLDASDILLNCIMYYSQMFDAPEPRCTPLLLYPFLFPYLSFYTDIYGRVGEHVTELEGDPGPFFNVKASFLPVKRVLSQARPIETQYEKTQLEKTIKLVEGLGGRLDPSLVTFHGRSC